LESALRVEEDLCSGGGDTLRLLFEDEAEELDSSVTSEIRLLAVDRGLADTEAEVETVG
jgi:hypothetical protein